MQLFQFCPHFWPLLHKEKISNNTIKYSRTKDSAENLNYIIYLCAP